MPTRTGRQRLGGVAVLVGVGMAVPVVIWIRGHPESYWNWVLMAGVIGYLAFVTFQKLRPREAPFDAVDATDLHIRYVLTGLGLLLGGGIAAFNSTQPAPARLGCTAAAVVGAVILYAGARDMQRGLAQRSRALEHESDRSD